MNGEIFGGTLQPEPGKNTYPEWIDYERKILVICSQKYELELTEEQQKLLVKFTTTTDPNLIFSWLNNIILKNQRCVVLCTYQSAGKLRMAIDQLANTIIDEKTIFGISCYDEAHCVCTSKRQYLFGKVIDKNDQSDDDADDENNDNDDDTFNWSNLHLMGYRF